MNEDVLERVRVFVMSQEPWRAIEALRLIDALTAAQARVEELERMVVWCAENAASYQNRRFEYDGPFDRESVKCYADPASILAAVQRAMGEK